MKNLELHNTQSLTHSLVNWKTLICSLSFESVVVILTNNFFCYVCLSLFNEFRCLFEPTKTTKISIQPNTSEFTVYNYDIIMIYE